jgi:hypothetical protein
MALFIFIWFLNLGISFWNAYAVGSAWVESKHAGGWRRFVTWMGAVMTAVGFTWCTLIVLGLITNQVGWLNDYSFEILMNLGYLVIVPFVLFAGYAIMLDSWQRAYRERTLANFGVAGYNTFASAYNTYHAVNGMGKAFEMVFDALLGGKGRRGKDEAKGLLILFLLIVSIGFGTMVTWALINRFAARDEPLPAKRQMERSF